MDVVDARASLGFEVRVMDRVKHDQIATGRLEGDYVASIASMSRMMSLNSE